MEEQGRERATLAGGCFWCLEAVFEQLRGVDRVESGYCGGHVADPSYEQVCAEVTGHAEAVQVVFDPQAITFRELLELFFAMHDPTTLNRQGPDVGSQYRSAVFYHSPEQKAIAEESIAELGAAGIFKGPVVTEVTPLTTFYPAEEYHRQYYQRNWEQPYCQALISPKLSKLRKQFSEKLKAGATPAPT